MGSQVGAQNEEYAGIGDVGLVPGNRTDLLADLWIPHHEDAVVLHIEGGGGELGQTDEFGKVLLGHYMIWVIVLDRPAGFNGFPCIHAFEKGVN
jgi:hypothetical protein